MSAAIVFQFPLQNGFEEWDGPDAYGPMPELPKPRQRWTVRRKAAVVEAVRGGWIPIEEACELYSISVDEFLAWERDLDRYGVHGLRTTRHREPRLRRERSDQVREAGSGRVMPILFWVFRDEEEARWLVTVEDQAYGGYLTEGLAILDAIDLANDARIGGNTAEVWHRGTRARLY